MSPNDNRPESAPPENRLTPTILTAALAIAACNTVRGAARDVNSVANCTENAVNGRNC